MPRSPISNVSPKAHGAWLGAGGGASAAAVIVGLIQDYWTHAVLPASAVQGIYIVAAAVTAFAGAYILPGKSAGQAQAEDSGRLRESLAGALRQTARGTGPAAVLPMTAGTGQAAGGPAPEVRVMNPPGSSPEAGPASR